MNGPGDSVRLLDAAERIADGRPLDAHALEAELDPELVECLLQLQALAGLDAPSAEAAAPVEAPTAFGPLTLLRELGRGASGVVYLARDPVLGRDVALKLCRAGRLGNAELLREAQLMARIDHPNVLRVHGAAEHDGVVGFWSERLDGGTLEAWSAANPRPGAAELVAVGLELCSALAAIHGLGLVHGDLKPANVLRHPDGRWVLADFGCSAEPSASDPVSGTPLYLAPEVLGGGTPDARSDLYALGVLLFRLATGRCPVEGRDLPDLLRAHREERRARLLDLRPDLPLAVIAAIDAALEPDASRRPVSAGAMAHALGMARPGAPAAVAPARRWAIAALALIAIGVVGLAYRGTEAPPVAAPDLALLRSVDGLDLPLRDGERVAPGDAVALGYRHAETAWVYVLNEDARGRVHQLFPLPALARGNPLPAGESLRLPGRLDGGEVDWQITTRGGHERFHVVVSPAPIPELEASGFAQASAEAALDSAAGALAALSVTRGAGGLSPRPTTASATDGGVDALLQRLRSEYPALHLRRFELANP